MPSSPVSISSAVTTPASSPSFSASAPVSPSLLVNFILQIRLISASLLPPVSSATTIQLSSQLFADRFEVHEVAESRPGTLSGFILPTAGLSEISDRSQFCIDWSSSEPAIVQICTGLQSIIFLFEFDIYISNKMVTQIVTDVHLLNLSIFILALHKDVLKEVVVVFLHLLVCHIGKM